MQIKTTVRGHFTPEKATRTVGRWRSGAPHEAGAGNTDSAAAAGVSGAPLAPPRRAQAAVRSIAGRSGGRGREGVFPRFRFRRSEMSREHSHMAHRSPAHPRPAEGHPSGAGADLPSARCPAGLRSPAVLALPLRRALPLTAVCGPGPVGGGGDRTQRPQPRARPAALTLLPQQLGLHAALLFRLALRRDCLLERNSHQPGRLTAA